MMKSFCQVFVVLLLAALPSARCWGHGMPLVIGYDVGTNKLTVEPNVYARFETGEMFTPVASELFTDYPGYEQPVAPATPTVPGDSIIGLNLLDKLYYWNTSTGPGDPLPTATVDLRIESNAALTTDTGHPRTSVTIGAGGVIGASSLEVGLIGGGSGDHVHGEFWLPDPSPAGLYAIVAELSATFPDDPQPLNSEPFLIILNNGVGTDEDYDTGADRLSSILDSFGTGGGGPSAVPEPAALGLVLGAMVLLSGVRRTDRRRGPRRTR